MTTLRAESPPLSPDTPAAARLSELLQLIPHATADRIRDYIDAHYTPANAGRFPLGERIRCFIDWQARGGMRIVDVALSTRCSVQAIVEHPVSAERRTLRLDVESDPPHRIDAVIAGRAPLPPVDPPLADQMAVDRFIAYTDRLAAAGLFSGAVLIARHGRILGQHAWGLANRDFSVPNSVHTRFNVASINKTWTAVAVAQLVEAGKLAFDDPVSKYLDYPDAASARKIRIKHLLSHTSGLQSYFTDAFERTARHHLRSVDDYLALSSGETPAFEPGTGWAYSNTGMLLAGKIVELVSARTYCDYVHTKVLTRAGMERSGSFELDRVNENLAVGYAQRWTPAGFAIVNNIFEHVIRGGPAGGCYSTVGDLFRFAEALRTGCLVSKGMAGVLTTAKPDLGSPFYGYGFTVHPDNVLFGHEGRFIGISGNLDVVTQPPGWTVVILANDNSMRAPALKARQLIGVTVPEAEVPQALVNSRPRVR